MVGVKLKALDIVVGGQSLALVVGECLPGALVHLREIQDNVGSLIRVGATVAGAERVFMLSDLDPAFPSGRYPLRPPGLSYGDESRVA